MRHQLPAELTLDGVAVQTGVVIVVSLYEALDRRTAAGTPLTEEALFEATVAGAVQRLRPKLMTVVANVAGPLPILWSTGVGSGARDCLGVVSQRPACTRLMFSVRHGACRSQRSHEL